MASAIHILTGNSQDARTAEAVGITTRRPFLFPGSDPTQLHQVVLNLATNALHAMRDRNGVLGIDLARLS